MLHVTPAQFDAITCNRCGTCCEGLRLPSPIGKRATVIDALAAVAEVLPWALHDCDQGLPIYRASRGDHRFTLFAHGERTNYSPTLLQFHEHPSRPFPERRQCRESERTWHCDRVRLARWMLELEPAGEDAAGWPRWACPRFERDADGIGVCTRYDERPRICSDFPYGYPMPEYALCSWNVALISVRGAQPPTVAAVAA